MPGPGWYPDPQEPHRFALVRRRELDGVPPRPTATEATTRAGRGSSRTRSVRRIGSAAAAVHPDATADRTRAAGAGCGRPSTHSRRAAAADPHRSADRLVAAAARRRPALMRRATGHRRPGIGTERILYRRASWWSLVAALITGGCAAVLRAATPRSATRASRSATQPRRSPRRETNLAHDRHHAQRRSRSGSTRAATTRCRRTRGRAEEDRRRLAAALRSGAVRRRRHRARSTSALASPARAGQLGDADAAASTPQSNDPAALPASLDAQATRRQEAARPATAAWCLPTPPAARGERH